MQTKNRTFNLGKIKINDTSPVSIITEIGINHSGSLNEAYKLVDLAKKNGSKIIKVPPCNNFHFFIVQHKGPPLQISTFICTGITCTGNTPAYQ